MFRLIPTISHATYHCSVAPRAFSTVGTAWTASHAAELSGYHKIDFCIDEDASVLDAVKRFVGHNIGCLATVNSKGTYPVNHKRLYVILVFEILILTVISRYNTYSYPYIQNYDTPGELTGIVSERDYITKVDLLGKTPEGTSVKDILTPSSKLVTANPEETVQVCMEKMLAADIRHLPLVDHGVLKGMISIKDLVKTCVKEQEQTIKVLSDFALGKSLRY